MSVLKAFVWSIAPYGSETWTLQKSDIRRIEAFEVDLASQVENVLDGAQKEWWSAKNSWNKKENHGDTEDVEDMDYSQLTQGAGTGESKMVSMDNENLPIGQNTTAAAYII